MMKPIAHGASGFASGCRREPTHIEVMRKYSTPVIRDKERERELAEAANLPYRSVTELYRGSGHSHSWADSSFPVVWATRLAIGYWRNRLNLYDYIYRSFISAS